MNIRPLNDRVIIERLAADSVSKGGIIIPDNAKEKPSQGKVIAVGSGTVLADGTIVPIGCVPGDTVLFGKYQGAEVSLDGISVLVVRADDILGVIESDEP
jgi:chaperonin GroES